MPVCVRACLLVVCVLACPLPLFAQSVLTGIVRSSSGEVVADVAVEVSSPALIESKRTTTSDTAGRYRVKDLRPGTYAVSFMRNGFRVLRVELIEIGGTRTFTVDATLTAGSSLETVVMISGAPLDVRSPSTQLTFDQSLIRVLPTTQNYNSLLALVPGVTLERKDLVFDPLVTTFPIHGGRADEGRLLVDGMTVGSAPHGDQPAYYLADIPHAAEVTLTTSGVLGESETGGVLMNVVPNIGGNSWHGASAFAWNGEAMLGDNGGEVRRNSGIGSPPPFSAWEVNGAIGGPIARDRAWVFADARTQRVRREMPSLFFNANAGDPTKWLYTPDYNREAYSDRTWDTVTGRVTFLATRNNRVSLSHDEQAICRWCSGATGANGFPDPTVSPEAQGVADVTPQRLDQVAWNWYATDRTRVEAGASRFAYTWGNSEREGNRRDLVRVTETTGGFFSFRPITYRSQDWADNNTSTTRWHATVAAFRGAHVMKGGYEGLYAVDDRTSMTNDQGLAYRFSNGLPSSIVQTISPFTVLARAAQTSAYLQDEWNRGRLTLHGAVRYDRARSWFPGQTIAGSRFLPSGLTFPKTDGVNAYTDVTPRAGVAYDVTGEGRTVLRINGGKYLQGIGTTGVYYDVNPVLQVQRIAARAWSDFNRNYIPDCDLLNPRANLECGSLTVPLFGQYAPTVTFAPDVRQGSGVRPSDWSAGASLEHRILPAATLSVGYFRRWFDGLLVTDNLAIGPADFTTFSVTVPVAQGTTGTTGTTGTGTQVIQGLYQLNPARAGLFNLLTTRASNYGNVRQYADSIDVLVNGRTPFGLTVMGGLSSTRAISDTCEIRAQIPEMAPSNPYCDTSTGFLTDLKGIAAYTIPSADVQIGAVYLNKPGPQLVANYSTFAPVPFGGFPFVTVNLIEPGTQYGDRISQLDLRATKLLRVGHTRVAAGIDLYNAFNSASPLTYNFNFNFGGGHFPSSVITPRLLRVTADVIF